MEKKIKSKHPGKVLDKSRILFGKHPVWAAVESGRSLDRVYLQRGIEKSSYGRRLKSRLARSGIPHTTVNKETLERIAPGANHQGVIALVGLKSYLTLDELLEVVKRERAPFLLVLNKVQDPHNLGSLLRSAEGAGVNGIIIPRHHACGLTPGAVRVASGAAEYISIARVTNIAKTLGRLEKEGYLLIGAAPEADLQYYEPEYHAPLTLVIGGEEKGLSPYILGKLHRTVRIPMKGKITSLNTGVAGAIIMYEIRRQLDRD
ncbi:MAG: 23S rRNA (guanosine(2251)-2'-O)-methyltransferase RlmB [Candidatus Eremiobacteraeota bacterium]|nr:23S rRNA (guanosine(2251)-2'-O)-methyltransferase RlmB [Candidatus Eremiobacteraeota bacterium]